MGDSIDNDILESGQEFIKNMKNNIINNPPYYKSKTGLEVIDVIESFNLDFKTGAIIKYILRAGKKQDELEDLKKAEWFLKRKIAQLEKGN